MLAAEEQFTARESALEEREEHARAEAEKLRHQLASHGTEAQQVEARAAAVSDAADAQASAVQERVGYETPVTQENPAEVYRS